MGLLWASIQLAAIPQLLDPDILPTNQSVSQPVSQSVNPSTPTPTAALDPRLTAANQAFGFKLFSQLVGQDASRNLLISPTSISMALSMLYNGAAGNTQQAMTKTLELQGLSLSELNQANAALLTALEQADPAVKLSIANSLWGRDGIAFNPDFLQQTQMFYQAEIASLDFNSPDAVGRINGWVSQNTNGKIPQIIDQIDPAQILFLINAVYFKGNWTTQFDPAKTTEQPFHRFDGSQKLHPLMAQRGQYLYTETEQFQAISLPYGNRRLSMDIVLPKAGSSLNEVYRNLDAATWETWRGQFRRREGEIRLPKFTFEYDTNLIPALEALGMGDAFGERADFSNLSQSKSQGKLQVDQVKHKSFIEVNETGTEAAAVTSIGVRATSINPVPPFQMTVDRPFFCAIRDSETGTLLFIGSVVDPIEPN